MSSIWGERLKISLFGESHGAAIGVVLDGLPAGEAVDLGEAAFQMSRRSPGHSPTASGRRESDSVEVLSGLTKGCTNGAPLCAVIRNHDAHPEDYTDFSHIPRPGHADFTARVRYDGHSDFSGGGHFSGRLTAPLCFAGAVCRQILSRRGIGIGAHLFSVGNIKDIPLRPEYCRTEQFENVMKKDLPAFDDRACSEMAEAIIAAGRDGDSVGGIVECLAFGLPAGIGDPIFGGFESRLASIIFGIPAVKGLEFGSGFEGAASSGSENNDPYAFDGQKVITVSNRHGGVLGGITTGMPVMFRVAFKPTPSISKPQQSVDLEKHSPVTMIIKGRHDPCIAVRAVPVVESAAAVCILDFLLEAYGYGIGNPAHPDQ